MARKVIIPGLLGGIALVLWTFVVNGLLGFKNRMDLKPIPDERGVYEVLKKNIVEPGRYGCNPELTPERRFPDNEPVFSVLYGGVGHEAAGGIALLGLVVMLLAPLVGAWMLSKASAEFLSSFSRKVLFFTAIGVLLALRANLSEFGIGSYPLGDALILAAHSILAWTFVGCAVAWRMKPGSKQRT